MNWLHGFGEIWRGSSFGENDCGSSSRTRAERRAVRYGDRGLTGDSTRGRASGRVRRRRRRGRRRRLQLAKKIAEARSSPYPRRRAVRIRRSCLSIRALTETSATRASERAVSARAASRAASPTSTRERAGGVGKLHLADGRGGGQLRPAGKWMATATRTGMCVRVCVRVS